MSENTTSHLSPRRCLLILVLGAPGAGKGTLCRRLATDTDTGAELRTAFTPGSSSSSSSSSSATTTTRHHLTHVSTGDLLRRMRAQGQLAADNVERQVLMGGRALARAVASADVVSEVLGRADGVLVLDGVPRNMDQLRAFEETFGKPDLVISLECPRQVALGRYLGRRDASRPDGDVALFEKRCDEFERENPGILEYYKAQGRGRVVELDVGSSSRSIDENYSALKQRLVESFHLGLWDKQGIQD